MGKTTEKTENKGELSKLCSRRSGFVKHEHNLPSPAFQALSGEFLPPPFSMRLWLLRANSVCSRWVFLHTSRHSDWCVFWNPRVWLS